MCRGRQHCVRGVLAIDLDDGLDDNCTLCSQRSVWSVGRVAGAGMCAHRYMCCASAWLWLSSDDPRSCQARPHVGASPREVSACARCAVIYIASWSKQRTAGGPIFPRRAGLPQHAQRERLAQSSKSPLHVCCVARRRSCGCARHAALAGLPSTGSVGNRTPRGAGESRSGTTPLSTRFGLLTETLGAKRSGECPASRCSISALTGLPPSWKILRWLNWPRRLRCMIRRQALSLAWVARA